MEDNKVDPAIFKKVNSYIRRCIEAGKFKTAAQTLLFAYEGGVTQTQDNMIGPFALQRLGYEMSKDPNMNKRLDRIADNLSEDEKIGLFGLLPDLFVKNVKGLEQFEIEMIRERPQEFIDNYTHKGTLEQAVEEMDMRHGFYRDTYQPIERKKIMEQMSANQ